MKIWLRNKLRLFLGIKDQDIRINNLDTLYKNLASIGVDVHFKEPHMILIYSRLGGGQIREIRADFKDLKELNYFVKELKNKYRTNHEYWDLPYGVNRESLKI